MGCKELYDKIIQLIEDKASDENVSVVELAEEVAASVGYNLVSMNGIFNFLTGQTLVKYVKERKMMTAYRHLIGKEKLDIDGACSIAGYGGHQAFDKAFRRSFGMTPTGAFGKKDMPLVTFDLLDFFANSLCAVFHPTTVANCHTTGTQNKFATSNIAN